jgi:hypothetical protein
MSWKLFKKLNRQISPAVINPKENVPNGPIPSGIRLDVGLNMQATRDAQCWFIDVSIRNPV